MIYQLKRTQTNRRPQAFWGSLIPSALSFVGGLITSSQQAKAQRRALEEQQRLAKQQLDISNQNQLATTLNNYAIAQQSYDDKDYNLKYRIGGVKRLGGRNIMITDGGNAKRIGNNTYLLRGGSHEDINETGQTGIGINVGGNEIEAEGGEVAQRKGNSLRIYSAQPILGGISPAEAIMKGYNKDRIFNAQQRFKKNNGIKDDGSKAQNGIKVLAKRVTKNPNGTLRYNSTFTPNNGRAKPMGINSPEFQFLMGLRGLNIPALKSASEPIINYIKGKRINLSKEYPDLKSGLLEYGRQLQGIVNPFMRYGGLTSKDRGSSKRPYPSVSSKDFAGGNRSYPIPTKADAIDALRLAGLHGRSDVRSRVYSKYPELRKKARGGTKVDPYYDWAINTSSNLGISFIDPNYDYRAYYNSVTPYERNLIRFAPQGTHFTDIGKTPKHPTFSNESIYSNKKHSGGTWNGNVFVPNIWQFGNNGNKVRNKYMNNSGEGYFNGRVNIFPKYRKKAEIGTLVPGGIPGTDSYRARMHSGYNISPFDLLNILNYLDRAVGFVDENGNTRYITGIAPAPGIPNKAQIIRNIQQANKVAQATRASQAAQRTSYAVKQAKDFYRDLGINIPVGRSQTYNPAFRSSALARNIEDSNKALQMSLNTHLPKGIRLTSADQSSIGRTAARVINPREAELVKQGINISQSARNMTSGSNPFLYAERTPSQIKAGLNRAFGVTKQGVKNAGQKVKDFRNKVTNSNTYRSKTGFEERYNPTLGAYEQYNTYKLKPWVKATAGAAGTAGVIGLGVGLSNTKSEDKSIKAQLDAKGKPISPYIARPQEPAKSQTKTVKPTRQVNKVVKRQVRTTPQYTGNTTKGNYQLHDGETKVINGVKYTRRGNTIINHKTNVGYIYDKNGNYTGQADYSKVGNFNQAFDLARAAGRNQFIYHAGKYNNYSTVKETNAKKEALNRRIGARRIAKRMGGLTNPPVERFKCGGHIRPKAEDGMLAPIYSYGTNRRRLPSFAPIDITPRAIPNFKPVSVSTNTKTPFDPNSVPFLGNQSTFKPATQDYIGLGIDTLAALGSGMFTRSAYNKMNFDYALPNYVDESPVAFDTTYHNEAQRANIERNRLNARNLIRGNTASAQTSLGRMQQSDVDAMMETNKLLDEKSNKEVELRNQNAANEQQVRARNAAARNQYYQNVAQIKNAAIEAKNNMELAKAQSIGVDLSGLSQAWTNFAGSVEQRYDNRQKEAIIAATSKDPAVLSNAVQFGYNFSPEVLAAIYNSTDDDNLKSLALSQLSTKNRLRYGIR